jgi:hypothetical protein
MGALDDTNNEFRAASPGLFSTTELVMSVRSDNTTVQENQATISSLVKMYDDKTNVGDDIKDDFETRKDTIKLKYYESISNGNQVLHGLKLTDSLNSAYINSLINGLQDGE